MVGAFFLRAAASHAEGSIFVENKIHPPSVDVFSVSSEDGEDSVRLSAAFTVASAMNIENNVDRIYSVWMFVPSRRII